MIGRLVRRRKRASDHRGPNVDLLCQAPPPLCEEASTLLPRCLVPAFATSFPWPKTSERTFQPLLAGANVTRSFMPPYAT
ncbi:hypothetical protein PsYK624_096980 [Phanerochaete sordida]|uniref:Uncharacterized protein n=1 Tax=Phanerochaete sordida TaxID=48140 RepID=A0A9P3GFU7_9APHY|nr:hypothetical protein PsYK624_096980 [Phanerochaete sordida]